MRPNAFRRLFELIYTQFGMPHHHHHEQTSSATTVADSLIRVLHHRDRNAHRRPYCCCGEEYRRIKLVHIFSKIKPVIMLQLNYRN